MRLSYLAVLVLVFLPACTVYDSRGGGGGYSSSSSDEYYKRPVSVSSSPQQMGGALVADVDLGMSLSLFNMYYKTKASDNIGLWFGASFPDPMSGIFKMSVEPPEGKMGVYATAGCAFAAKQSAYEYSSGGLSGTFEVESGFVALASVGYRAMLGKTTMIHFEIGNGWLLSGGEINYISGDDTPETRGFFEYTAPGGPILLVGIEAGF